MTDDQVADYGGWAGLGDTPRAKDVVAGVRGLALIAIEGSVGRVGSGATVTIEER
jgi:hypothetical protein